MTGDFFNEQNANFFFKILPSGSLRKGYGKPLPSTSILGTDYDLTLVPDGIKVAESIEDSSAGSSGNVLQLNLSQIYNKNLKNY